MTTWTERTTEADKIRVFHGDSRDVLRAFPDAHFDSVVCDPPYALVSITKRFGADNAAPAQVGASGAYARASAGFMGQKWDTGETAFAVEFWAEVYRVLKPGGHVIAFSGTRTYHRLACAVEDAGFEIRDMVAWLYGSGFPKSHDVSKGIDKAAGVAFSAKPASGVGFMGPDGPGGYNVTKNQLTRSGEMTDAARQWQGWGTALKPALEPIVLARKPLSGTVAANVLQHGTGALNIDASRIDASRADIAAAAVPERSNLKMFVGDGDGRSETRFDMSKGRWPANVIHDGSEDVVGAFPETGVSSGGGGLKTSAGLPHSKAAGAFYDGPVGFADSGSAARFFKSARPDAHCGRFWYSSKADQEDRLGSKHPTVKPVDLMAYLVRLVTPPGGLTLDPFAGSGTTGVGAMREGMRCVLIEREEAYVDDIVRKLAWARGEGRLTALEVAKLDTPERQAAAAGADLPLFG